MSGTLAQFRIGGFSAESQDYSEPTQVTCTRCGSTSEFTWRDDGGADRTEDLAVLVSWARGHDCAGAPGPPFAREERCPSCQMRRYMVLEPAGGELKAGCEMIRKWVCPLCGTIDRYGP